ncbi:MAG: endonuclease/exonuclease/phosphatase family protein [Candidatus Eisenbacteria bacterium]
MRSFRRVLWPALYVALLFARPALAAAAPQSAGADTLTVVTLNLWHDQHDWPRRLERIVRELGALRPDVICLQEVLQHATLPNQAETLAQRLGYAWSFATVDSVTRVKRYGNAILTRHPVLDTGEHFLRPLDDYRVVARVRVSFHGHVLDVYDTHLHHTREGAAIRAAQIADLRSYIRDTRGRELVLLAGDLNCSPDTPELQALSPEWLHAWAAVHSGRFGPEAATMNPLFEPEPRQIDHVFVARDSRPVFSPVEAKRLFDQVGPDSVWATDHFGVLTRFTIPPVLGTPETTYAQHLALGRAAARRDERAAARHHLREVDAQCGGHTGAQAGLAALAARDGDREQASRWLGAIARSGIAHAFARDTSFARWADDPTFAALTTGFERNAQPHTTSRVRHELHDPELLAEDVVYDARGKRFLVSSIHQRRIVAVNATGRVTPFSVPGADSTWGLYGLGLDAARGLLWASTAAGPECDTVPAAEIGRTAVVAFDLRTGRVRRRIELPVSGTRQVLGDLCVGADGSVYVTESLGGAVYRLRSGANALERLVAPGTYRSPQQPALAADGRHLYVADYSRGIGVIDLDRGTAGWLPKPYSLASGGIDGLVRQGDRLIAIQNGTAPHRVLALDLTPAGDAITGWQVLEKASPRMGEPNHGVVMGDTFVWIGDSGWDRVSDDGKLASPAGATAPVLMSLPLPARPLRSLGR